MLGWPVLLPPVAEARLRAHLYESGGGPVLSLRLWADLRREFPLLCGEAPYPRWMETIYEWTVAVRTVDSGFSPVSFQAPLTMGPVIAFPSSVLRLRFHAQSPTYISKSFDRMVEGLFFDTLADLGLNGSC